MGLARGIMWSIFVARIHAFGVASEFINCSPKRRSLRNKNYWREFWQQVPMTCRSSVDASPAAYIYNRCQKSWQTR